MFSSTRMTFMTVAHLTNFFQKPDDIASNDRMTSEQYIGKDVAESDRGQIWCTIPVISWRDLRKLLSVSVRIADFRIRIWSWTFQYMKQSVTPTSTSERSTAAKGTNMIQSDLYTFHETIRVGTCCGC
jgi:hypothetical protein